MHTLRLRRLHHVHPGPKETGKASGKGRKRQPVAHRKEINDKSPAEYMKQLIHCNTGATKKYRVGHGPRKRWMQWR